MFQHFRMTAAALLSLGLTAGASALNIQVDYSGDTAGFFSGFPSFSATATAALEAAAADIEAAITTTLNATVDTNSATVGSSSATFNFKLNYSHPTSGVLTEIADAAVAADIVKIYVGSRLLTGSTLGQGGPGGAGLNASGSISNPTDFAAAVDNAEAAANANLLRGGGPAIGNLSGSLGGEAYSIDYGSTIGNLWFDRDTNNNGAADSAAVLNAFWHFDHTTSVVAGKRDFYSVALHEILHSLGFGASESWNDQVSPSDSNDWLGPNAIALLGSGNEVLESDSNHVISGAMSTRISDDVAQEAVMDPTITVGTRKYLTWLDLAFLDDFGWDVIPMPVPGDTDGDGDVDADDVFNVKENFGDSGPDSPGDADGDGDCDIDDLVAAKNNFGYTPPGLAFVPEPASLTLLALLAASALVRPASAGRRRIAGLTN